MNFSEFVTQQLKPLNNAIKANHVLYALHHNEPGEKIETTLSAISSLCQKLGDYAIQGGVDLGDNEYRIYTKSSKIRDTEYFCFAPHVRVGYSPFLLYQVDGKTLGVWVKMRQHRFIYCSKTINKLSQALYEKFFKEDQLITMKEAKSQIRQRMKENNPDNVPLIEKLGEVTFYIDLENQRALAKSGHRDQDALAAFFNLLKNFAEKAEKNGESKLADIISAAFDERVQTAPYSQFALSSGSAYGAYNLNNLVLFYASESNSDGCAVQPTWSAGFVSKNDSSQVISFKNSIGLFLDGVDPANPPPTTFTMMNGFAQNKELNFSSLRVTGEIPRGALVAEYLTEVPEAEEEIGEGDFFDTLYTTQSKDGNVAIQVSDPLKWQYEAARKLIINKLNDQHFALRDMERVVNDIAGGMLQVLHDSIDMFVKLYLESNQAEETFGEDQPLEEVMN